MYNQSPKHIRFLAYLPVSLVIIWFSLRYLGPALAPFLLAFSLAWLVDPCVVYLSNRLNWPRWVSTLFILLVGLSTFLVISCFFVARLWSECLVFLQKLPTMSQEFTSIASQLNHWAYPYIISFPTATQPFLWETLHQLTNSLSYFSTFMFDWLIQLISNGIQQLPNLGFTLLISVLAFYFTSSEYKGIIGIFHTRIPADILSILDPVPHRLRASLCGWLKSQFILMLLCFVQLYLLFLLLDLDYALSLALLISIVDALPVLGAGAILLPWAVSSFILGHAQFGISLLLIYFLVSVVRGTLEPKLIGLQVGIPPLFTLITLYAGFYFGGILGLLFAPLISILIKEVIFPPNPTSFPPE